MGYYLLEVGNIPREEDQKCMYMKYFLIKRLSFFKNLFDYFNTAVPRNFIYGPKSEIPMSNERIPTWSV